MSDTTPTNPADDELRKQIALAIAGDTPDAKHFLDEADAALTVVAPVLEGLRAELDAMSLTARQALRAVERRDKEIANLRADRAVALPEDWQAQLAGIVWWHQDTVSSDALERLERRLTKLISKWQAPSVSDQTPATPNEPRRLADALELIEEMHGYVPAYFADKWQINERIAALRSTAPSSVQGDTTPVSTLTGLPCTGHAPDHRCIECASDTELRAATSAPSEGDTTPEEA